MWSINDNRWQLLHKLTPVIGVRGGGRNGRFPWPPQKVDVIARDRQDRPGQAGPVTRIRTPV
jgi:hypothetical protein